MEETQNKEGDAKIATEEALKALERIALGDPSKKTEDTAEWRKQFKAAISVVAIRYREAQRAVDEYAESERKAGRYVFDRDKLAMDPKYRELSEAAFKARTDAVEKLSDAVKPSEKIEKWIKENDFSSWYRRSVPIEDVIVFEDGYGRGDIFSYEDPDDDSNDGNGAGDRMSEIGKEVDKYETLYVRVLGTVTDEDHEMLKELDTAACFLSRNGYYLPMKERVALVMDTFVKVFRNGWKWAFFIPHVVASC